MFKIVCLVSVLLILLSYVNCQHSLHASESVQQSATSSNWPYSQQNSQSSGHEYHSGQTSQRQGTSLGSLPMLSFLPILIMVGVGALLIIPILFLLFNSQMGMAGLGVGGFPGAAPFGKKRSVSNSLLDQNMLLEMIGSVGSVLEQHIQKFETKVPKKN